MLRGRRDILRNSDVGAIFLSRQSAGASSDRNQVAGVDANFRFVQRAQHQRVPLASRATPGVDGGEMAGKGSVVWNDNFLHTQYSLLSVGDNFRDDIGFIKRRGIRKHFADFGIRFRPEWWRKLGIRELHPHTRYNIYTDQSNTKVTHTNHVAMAWFFERGGYLELQWNPRFERITAPFTIRPDQSFAPGSYGWNEYVLELETDHSRKVSGSALITSGRVLERHAAVDQGRRALPAVVSPDVRRGAAAQRHPPAAADARLRHQPRHHRASATRSTRGRSSTRCCSTTPT